MVMGIRGQRPKTRPAPTSGDGLQPLSAPWCSSRVTMSKPCSSAYPDMATEA